jgi:hypothetical protein
MIPLERPDTTYGAPRGFDLPARHVVVAFIDDDKSVAIDVGPELVTEAVHDPVRGKKASWVLNIVRFCLGVRQGGKFPGRGVWQKIVVAVGARTLRAGPRHTRNA